MFSYKKIVIKSIFAIIVYLVIVSLAYTDPVKEYFDDFAYDRITADYLNLYESNFEQLTKETIPKVDMFLIEDEFIDYYKLKNYGYVFPRYEMNSIVQSLNYTIEEMTIPPQIVFIDYDLHYTELPYGRKISPDDKKLIDSILRLSTKTIVMIPKAKKFHFIEEYLMANNLNNDNILFVSPNFLVADDLMSRRFQSYYVDGDRVYLNVDLAMYLLNTNKCKSVKELHNLQEVDDQVKLCGNVIKNFDVTQNRIISKFFIKYEDAPYNYGFTLWDTNNTNQKIKSISTLIEESIIPKSLEKSIIMIGSDFEGSNDHIAIAHSLSADPIKLPGIIQHLNALNSFYFFNGTLNNINSIYGSIIVLIVFLFFSYFEEKKNNSTKYIRLIRFVINVTAMSILFFIISTILLLEYKVWFNWFAPLFTFQVLEFLYKLIPLVKRFVPETILKYLNIWYVKIFY